MKYFHTITPISDERRENRKNEIDAYINDIKKTIVLIILRKPIGKPQTPGSRNRLSETRKHSPWSRISKNCQKWIDLFLL